MPFVPAPGVTMCSIRFTLYQQLVENTVYVLEAAEFETRTPAEVAEIVGIWAGTSLISQLSVDILFREVYAVSLDSETAGVGTYTPSGGPTAGGVPEPSMPGNVTWCVQFRGDGRGRSRRGRNYVPGLPTSVINDNQVTQSWATAVLNSYQALGSTLQTEGLQHVIVSRVADGVPRTTALLTPVTAYVGVDTTIDSQRRRLPGRGN